VTTWRRLRKEFVGAWRSVQYDFERARKRGTAGGDTTELIFPEHHRPPRRLLATGGFAVASVAGAVGTYLAVVNGLGTLLEPEAPAGETPASVVAGAAGTGQRPPATAPETTVRIGREGGPLTVAGQRAAGGSAGSWDTRDGVPTGVGPAPGLVRKPGAPLPEESDAPPGEHPAPTPSADPTPTPTPTDAPSPSPSASPSASDQPDEGRRRHRHHRRHADENP
jgi:hypothetical protein